MTRTTDKKRDMPTDIKSHHAPIEIKGLTEEGEFEGLASVFNVEDRGRDTILPGAFKKTLKDIKKDKRTIPFLNQHMRWEILGGFTEFEERKEGLWVKGQILPDLSDMARQVYTLMKSQLCTGLSIGYRVPPRMAEYSEKGRVIKQLDLYEISFTPMPMAPGAGVRGVKGLEEARSKLVAGDQLTEREWETILKKDLGLSNSEAERAIRVNSLRSGGGDPHVQGKGLLFQKLKAKM